MTAELRATTHSRTQAAKVNDSTLGQKKAT
jgi:hypothetical protein